MITVPSELYEVLKKNGAGGSSYRFLKAAHYGQGFRLYKKTVLMKAKKISAIVPINPPFGEFQNFSSIRKCTGFSPRSFQIWRLSILAFPEFILTNDYSKIDSVRRLQTAKMRYEKINPKTGLIENAYFCHNWGKKALRRTVSM